MTKLQNMTDEELTLEYAKVSDAVSKAQRVDKSSWRDKLCKIEQHMAWRFIESTPALKKLYWERFRELQERM